MLAPRVIFFLRQDFLGPSWPPPEDKILLSILWPHYTLTVYIINSMLDDVGKYTF